MTNFEVGRFLYDNVDVEQFVKNIIGIDDPNAKRLAVSKITAVERCLKGTDDPCTWQNMRIRDSEWRDEGRRNELRKLIVDELINDKRLSDDDEISLGIGGAAPDCICTNGRKVVYIIGPPAAGKSEVAMKIADAIGAYILDCDYAKRKLPEYSMYPCGASYVHEESDILVFSWKNSKNAIYNVQGHCVRNGYNMVIPKIGHRMSKLCEYAAVMRELNYKVFLVSVDLDRKKATQRAYDRFIRTNRYVPLSLIFDSYANDPTLNYFKIRQRNHDAFDGYAQISTDVERGESKLLVEEYNFPEISTLFRRE